LIEYDDHTQPPEAIKAIERLATVDKADWIVGLYSTGFNIAAVPTFTKLGYPQIAVACVTDLGEQLVKKNPRLFFANGTITQYSSTTIDVLKKLKDAGQLGSRVALVNVADEFGIEAANISKKLLPAAGFEIVYDKSYPLGTQDYAPVIKAVKGSNPDAFIAWSYPPGARLVVVRNAAEADDVLRRRTVFAIVAQAPQGRHRDRCRLQCLPVLLRQRPGSPAGIRGRRLHGS
jgi:branched-chain amino acid transport system substrate-binding protein